MATKSKMRIYKGRGYSDHEVHLYITVDLEGDATLHILTDHEDIWIPLRDVADLMREKWAEANDELLRDIADLMREKWAEANDELPEL